MTTITDRSPVAAIREALAGLGIDAPAKAKKADLLALYTDAATPDEAQPAEHAPGVSIRRGRVWTDLFAADGTKLAGVRTEHIDDVVAALTAAQ